MKMNAFGRKITIPLLKEYTSNKLRPVSRKVKRLRKPAMCMLHPLEYFTRQRMRRSMQLSPEMVEAVNAVETSGYCAAENFIDGNLFEELQAAANAHLPEEIPSATQQNSKIYWHHLMQREDFDADSIFVRFAMQQPVIQIVTQLFGQTPHLTMLELALTVADNGPQNPSASQRWHYDLADSKTVKLFIYLTDVSTNDDGPFSYIPKSICRTAVVPQFPVHKSDQDLEKHQILKSAKPVYGPSGTSFLIDTYNCLHSGSRFAPGHKRLAYIATFNSFCAWRPYTNNIFANRRLSDLEKLVFRNNEKRMEQ